MKEKVEELNQNFLNARSEYNQIYKNFLYISEHFQERFKEEYVDLFTASTFSKVVPEIVSEESYLAVLRASNHYRNYPSPEGNSGLIQEFYRFIKHIYHLDFSEYETMVCQGTMQAIDAISCILKGQVVFVMDATVTFAKSIPTANGATVVLIKTNNGILDLNDLAQKAKMYRKEDIKYLYLNYPNNPTGAQMTEKEFADVIELTQKYGIKIVHDHDICLTSYDVNRPVISIFQNKKAILNCIEIYTLSKEFGLSGLRVGIIVGNKEFIEMIQYHNYEMNVMIPNLNQKIAELALARIDIEDVTKRIYQSMKCLIEGFRELGWRDLAFPQAGIAYLLQVPFSFEKKYEERAGELFAFYLQRKFGVGVGPAKCNCHSKTNYIRVLSMEPKERCRNMFDRMRGHISPDMDIHEDLYDEYIKTISVAEKYNVR